jgi:hypothetical protein
MRREASIIRIPNLCLLVFIVEIASNAIQLDLDELLRDRSMQWMFTIPLDSSFIFSDYNDAIAKAMAVGVPVSTALYVE